MECVGAKNFVAQSVFDHESHRERGHSFQNLHIDCQNHWLTFKTLLHFKPLAEQDDLANFDFARA